MDDVFEALDYTSLKRISSLISRGAGGGGGGVCACFISFYFAGVRSLNFCVFVCVVSLCRLEFSF